MCLATPVKVKELNKKIATVFDGKNDREINVVMIEGLKVGDYILAHADLGIQKIDKAEALEILKLNSEYHRLEHQHKKVKSSK